MVARRTVQSFDYVCKSNCAHFILLYTRYSTYIALYICIYMYIYTPAAVFVRTQNELLLYYRIYYLQFFFTLFLETLNAGFEIRLLYLFNV